MRLAQWLVIIAGLMPLAAQAIEFSGVDLKGRACTGGGQGYGPFDYTNAEHVRHKLPVVENLHFTPEVERLIQGKSGYLLGDLDYTLRAFPNHHRALYALIRYVTTPRRSKKYAGKMDTPPECYLQRALRFQPKDGKVHLLYGLYLHRLKNLKDAEQHYRDALQLMPHSAEGHYNLALVLADMEQFEAARLEARQAYKLGYPLPGLKRRLAAAGYPLTP